MRMIDSDRSKCSGGKCKQKDSCLRYRCPGDTYQAFTLYKKADTGKGRCSSFIKLTKDEMRWLNNYSKRKGGSI
jgi:hypothetical protein